MISWGVPRFQMFRLAAPAEVLAGAALVGQAVLYRWPDEGGPRHVTVVRYSRTSPALGAPGGVSLAARRGLARPSRALGAPPPAARLA